MYNPLFWLFLSAIAAGASAALIFCVARGRKIMLGAYTYLEVIQYDWKSATEIKRDLEVAHRGYISFGEFQASLQLLESEGLIEKQIVPCPIDVAGIIIHFGRSEYKRCHLSYGLSDLPKLNKSSPQPVYA